MSLLLTGTGPPGTAWNPGQLSGLAATLLPAPSRDQGLLWQNTAKTVPAEVDGDPVRVAVCPYTGVEFAAPSDAARPLLYDEGSGKWSLSFDGVDDYLSAGDLSASVATQGCVGVRYFDPSANTSTIMILGQSRNGTGYDRFSDASSYSQWLRAARIHNVTPPPPVGTNTLLVRSSASRWQQRINGAATINAAANFWPATLVYVGQASSAGFDSNRVRGFILSGADPDDTTASLIESYLGTL